MRKTISIILFFIPAALFAGGKTSVEVLKNDISPKAVSMGGSYVALCDDIYSLYYNPAGLAQMNNPEVSFSYSGGFEDAKAQYIAFGSPIPVKGFANLGKGVMALSLHTTSLGDFNYRFINTDGSIYTKTVEAEKNTIFTLAYAEKVSEGDVKFDSYKGYVEQYMGIGFKYVKSTLLEDDDPPTTFAVDAGYKAVEPKLGLSFGLSLLNTMGTMKYVEEKYSLPTILRAGLSYQRPTVMDQQIAASVEYDKFVNDDYASLKLGMEYHLQQVLNFRVGYRMMEENRGFSFGVGLFSGSFSLDFASSMLAVYGNSTVSLSYKFDNFFPDEKKTRKTFKGEKSKKPERKNTKETEEKKTGKKAKPASGDFFWIY